ncbi:MAG: extracellular solute-binding protein [Lachnospiraceae bacterium]|nr:extracellular solute-binding protein [Lachnospiraceae bacterium]
MKRKMLSLVLATAMVASMLAGCSSNNSNTEGDPTEGSATKGASTTETSGDDIVINFLGAQYSDMTEPYLREVCDKFEEQNPGVKINLEIVGWDNVSDRARALVGARQAPDIYNGGTASEYVPDDLLYNIKDVVSDELLADFYPTFLDNNRNVDDGEVYALPYVASVRALYCNAKIFNEVGIEEPPKTWDEVEAACQKIDEFYNGDVYAWGIDATTAEGQTMMAYYGWTNGGGYVDENFNWVLDSDANVEGYEWAYKLFQNGWTNENPSIDTRDNMQAMFAENKMAMLVTACFFPNLYPDTEMIIGEIPYNDKNCSSSSTLGVQDGLMIFNGNAKKEEDSPEKIQAMKDFFDFFFAAENYVQFMLNEGLLPSTQSGAEFLAEKDPAQSAYVDILEGAKFYARNLTEWTEVEKTLIANEQAMFEGTLTPREALEETQAVAGQYEH